MSDKIEPGDLVYVVGNPHDLLCPHDEAFLGLPLKVEIIVGGINLFCPDCRCTWYGVEVAAFTGGKPGALRMSWLKKMQPPGLEVTEPADEKVTA